MYGRDELAAYPFFAQLLCNVSLETLHDPLTGVLARSFMLRFIQDLIARGTPFTLAIIDLDNFKYINDTYGHHVGDEVLAGVSKLIANRIRGFGFAGRFGGDELLMINLRDTDKDSNIAFFDKAYNSENAFRNRMEIEGHKLFITATTGCASYPEDASDYETLFSLIDKTLYHGKTKGRNCFTVYDEKIHKNLDIKKLAKQDLYTNMSNLMECLSEAEGFENRLKAIENIILEELNITEMLYTGKARRLHSLVDMDLNEDISDIDRLMLEDEIYTEADIENIKDTSPLLYEALRNRDCVSFLAASVGLNGEIDGYLIFSSAGSPHIWRQEEKGILYFVAKTFAGYIRLGNEVIPD